MKTFFEKRIRLSIYFTIALAFILVGRLYYLQVFQHEQYALQANKNRLRVKPIIPERGRILASDGSVLAFTSLQYRLVGDADLKKILISDINSLIKKNPKLADEGILNKAKKTPPFGSIIIKDKISWHEAKSYIHLLANYKSFRLEPCYFRVYPLKEAACHITGYLSAASSDSKLSALPLEYKSGKTGIEQHFNEKLAGILGVKKVEVNTLGIPVKELVDCEKINGEDIKTTINANLQQFVYSLLSKHKSASCIVMNVRNGHVLAMVSVPGFDPNKLANNEKGYWGKIAIDEIKPLINKSISGAYPPGSTFKPVVALAALKAGIIDKDTKFFCPGHMQIYNHTYHCWKRDGGHGYLNLEQALAKSCDVFFYNLALKLKLSDITDMAEKLGIGLKTGLGLPYEGAGNLPKGRVSYWRQRYFSQKVLISIGQGAITLTPLQLCLMVARLANGTQAVYPTLEKDDSAEYESLNIFSEHIDLVKKGMFLVCNMPGASGYARGYSPNYPMAGKTGTAQVVSLSDKRSYLWQYTDHGLFIGYAPIDNPKYAIAVVVDHGASGSISCVPIARQIFDYINENKKI